MARTSSSLKTRSPRIARRLASKSGFLIPGFGFSRIAVIKAMGLPRFSMHILAVEDPGFDLGEVVAEVADGGGFMWTFCVHIGRLSIASLCGDPCLVGPFR